MSPEREGRKRYPVDAWHYDHYEERAASCTAARRVESLTFLISRGACLTNFEKWDCCISPIRNTNTLGLGFRALLAEGVPDRLELAMA
jgi:hypothetical protein